MARKVIRDEREELMTNELSSRILSAAKTSRFDPDGFKQRDPLKRSIFYSDPYVTCRNCNLIIFVDVVTIRRMLALPGEVAQELSLKPEILPPCARCDRSDCFLIGSHDFSQEIADRERVAREKAERENAAASVIQRSYRAYLRRMYGSALSNAFLAEKYYKQVAATRITAAARGRLGRRRAKTERNLVMIRESSPILVKFAQRSQIGRPKVFWYKRESELKLLYKDYMELVKKTGFSPARKLVEDNIAEVAYRVLARKHQLIVMVQRRWRGFMTRRIVEFFRTEIVRLWQHSVSRALKIQRAFRGHFVRLQIPKLRNEQRRGKLLRGYLERGKDQLVDRIRTKISDKVAIAYRKEREEEKTARFASMIPQPKDYNMKKMDAFWDSMYADEKLGNESKALLEHQKNDLAGRKNSVNNENNRKDFIVARIAEHGPAGYGLRSVPKSMHFHPLTLSQSNRNIRGVRDYYGNARNFRRKKRRPPGGTVLDSYGDPVEGEQVGEGEREDEEAQRGNDGEEDEEEEEEYEEINKGDFGSLTTLGGHETGFFSPGQDRHTAAAGSNLHVAFDDASTISAGSSLTEGADALSFFPDSVPKSSASGVVGGEERGSVSRLVSTIRDAAGVGGVVAAPSPKSAPSRGSHSRKSRFGSKVGTPTGIGSGIGSGTLISVGGTVGSAGGNYHGGYEGEGGEEGRGGCDGDASTVTSFATAKNRLSRMQFGEISSRGQKMKWYFDAELADLTNRFIERNKHDFKKMNLKDQFRAHNEQRLATARELVSHAARAVNGSEGHVGLGARGGVPRVQQQQQLLSPLKPEAPAVGSGSALSMHTPLHHTFSTGSLTSQQQQLDKQHHKQDEGKQQGGASLAAPMSRRLSKLRQLQMNSTGTGLTTASAATDATLGSTLLPAVAHERGDKRSTAAGSGKSRAAGAGMGSGLRKNYKFPKDINFKAVDWLFGDDYDDCN